MAFGGSRIWIATIPARSAGESGVLRTYPASERRSTTSVTSSEVLCRTRSTPISRTMSRPAFAAYTAAFAVVPSSNRRAPSWNSNTFGSKSNMRAFPNQPAIVGRSLSAKNPPRQAPPDVRDPDPGPAEEPLEPARHEHVDVRRVHVGRQLAGCLVGIDQGEGSVTVGDLRDRADVLDRAARVVDVRGRDEGGAVVRGRVEEVRRHANPVLGRHEDTFRGGLHRPLIGERRELQIREDDPGTFTVVHGTRDGGQGDGHARGERDLLAAGAQDPSR